MHEQAGLFRFGVQAPTAQTGVEWRELAKKAEDLGFSVLVTPDHLDTCLSPLPPLVAAAEATTELRVGTMVLNNDLRHPALLAREAATIDLLTDGRMELGIGAGHAFPEYERTGLAFDPASVRVQRLSESVQILRRLLDGETLSFRGDHYTIVEESCYPRPAQEHLPLLVGGSGKRVLATAAHFADAVGFTGLGRTLEDGNRHAPAHFAPTAVDHQVDWVRSVAGKRTSGLEFQALVQVVSVSTNPRDDAARLGTVMPGLTVEELLGSPYLMIGTVEGLVDRLQEHRTRWGFSHYTVRADAIDAVAPILSRLAGT